MIITYENQAFFGLVNFSYFSSVGNLSMKKLIQVVSLYSFLDYILQQEREKLFEKIQHSYSFLEHKIMRGKNDEKLRIC